MKLWKTNHFLIQAKTSISVVAVLIFLKRVAPQTELCNIVCLLICQITTLLKSEQRSPLRNFDKKWHFKDHHKDDCACGNDGLGGGDDDGLGDDDDSGVCGRVAC